MTARLTAERIADIRDGLRRSLDDGCGCFECLAQRDLLAEIDALTADLKRATTKPSVEAGELVAAAVDAFIESGNVDAGAVLVQRALDAAEARGAARMKKAAYAAVDAHAKTRGDALVEIEALEVAVVTARAVSR